MTTTDERSRNDQYLIEFLRREARYSGVWFAHKLTEAADRLEALRQPVDRDGVHLFDLAAVLAAAEEFDDERGETPDGWFSHYRKRFPLDAAEEHCGDCTNVPMACGRCWAEHYLDRARALKMTHPGGR